MAQEYDIETLTKEFNKKAGEIVAGFGITYGKWKGVPFKSPTFSRTTYGINVPLGGMVQYAGRKGSGKTTKALLDVGSAQKTYPDKLCFWIDAEGTFDDDWAKMMGVDIDKLYFVKTSNLSAEHIFDFCRKLFLTGKFSLGILDSLGVLIPDQIKGEDQDKQQRGGIAKSLTRFTAENISTLKKYDSTFIGINQARDAMDDDWTDFVTNGGNAWLHNLLLNVYFREGEISDEFGNKLTRSQDGARKIKLRTFIEKSKICRKDRKNGYFTIDLKEGLDYLSDTIDLAVSEFKIIEQAGAWFYVIDVETGERSDTLKFQGMERLKNHFRENKEDFNKIHSYIMNKISEGRDGKVSK